MSKVVQLKITLKHSKPAIWRRILVPADFDFYDFHHVIQGAMGWENCHLFQFEFKDFFISDDGDDEGGDLGLLPLRKKALGLSETLEDILKKPKIKFEYEYDFGDSWEHTILVEKILDQDSTKVYPVCIAGELNCPPEDCGGMYGYYGMLEAINDESNPEQEEMIQWLGEDFDPEYFNLDEINERLQ